MAIVNAAQATVQLAQIDCGSCGGTYAISERYREQKQQEGGSWHCPYCRVGWGYAGNSENEKLKKELELQKKRTEWAKEDAARAKAAAARAENARRAEKAAKTRLKKRIGNGVCPCCRRSFENLRRHMASQHPDFTQPEKE